jgi:hypothetical protein
MVQVLCYTGKAFDTCWRPGSIAANVVKATEPTQYGLPTFAYFTQVRFVR